MANDAHRSAIDPLLQMLRIAGALYRDLGNRALDVAEIVQREFDATAPMFSSRRSSFRVPGIGTIHGF